MDQRRPSFDQCRSGGARRDQQGDLNRKRPRQTGQPNDVDRRGFSRGWSGEPDTQPSGSSRGVQRGWSSEMGYRPPSYDDRLVRNDEMDYGQPSYDDRLVRHGEMAREMGRLYDGICREFDVLSSHISESLLAEVKEREGRVKQREEELNLRERQLRLREEDLSDVQRDLKKLERARADAGFAALVLNSICRDKRCVDIGVGNFRKNDIITLLNEDFIIDKCLGKGVSGTVYSAMFIPKREKRIVNGAFPVICDGESKMGFQRYQSVAIKFLKDASKLDKEVKIHESLRDIRGVPKIFGWDSRAIIMENCGNNLHDIFLKEKRQPEHEDVLCFGLQILEIVEKMHRRGYLHRDIKPANLTMKEGKLHLIDFGESRDLDGKSHIESRGHSTSVYGSLNYNTVVSDGIPLKITKEDELWSVYFVLLELKTGNLDWRQARDDAAHKTKKHEHMYSCKQWFIQNRDCKIIKLLNKPDITYEEKLKSFKRCLKEGVGLF